MITNTTGIDFGPAGWPQCPGCGQDKLWCDSHSLIPSQVPTHDDSCILRCYVCDIERGPAGAIWRFHALKARGTITRLEARIAKADAEAEETMMALEAIGNEYRENDGEAPRPYWRNTAALDAEAKIRGLIDELRGWQLKAGIKMVDLQSDDDDSMSPEHQEP